MIVYELWHSQSNNLVATFDSEDETRRVLAAIFEDGDGAAKDFILTWDDVDEGADDDIERPGGFIGQGATLIASAKGGAFPPLVSFFPELS